MVRKNIYVELVVIIMSLQVFFSAVSFAAPKEKVVLAAMKKATDFMMNNVSYRGGFVWTYSEDLSRQWGEVPARRTQIWVQGATNGVGDMLIDAYNVTGDLKYLDNARRVANALIRGQHPAGGWHYFIDFDMPGIRKWYNEVASRCWGWEEYYHYYGNCTYDDDVTSSAARFLMHLYMTTLNPVYREPLTKALDFILESQFPNGAWPQRYPLMYDYPHDGHEDYTSFYTFNDNVIRNNIMLFLEAYEKLGNKEYKKAAIRGMNFYIISQYGNAQGGWAQQYDHNMNPAWARSYEPAAICSRTTFENIYDLLDFYRITGNRRYLRGIPDAIEWLERSVISELTGEYTHALWYEPVTNNPLYCHREGTGIDDGHYWVDYEYGNFICHYSQVVNIDIEAVKSEYARVKAFSPEEAIAEYIEEKRMKKSRLTVSDEVIDTLINSLDIRGAWVTDVRIPDYNDTCANNHEGIIIKGISTRVYVNNMRTLISYLIGLKK